jgi:hypothetical protein
VTPQGKESTLSLCKRVDLWPSLASNCLKRIWANPFMKKKCWQFCMLLSCGVRISWGNASKLRQTMLSLKFRLHMATRTPHHLHIATRTLHHQNSNEVIHGTSHSIPEGSNTIQKLKDTSHHKVREYARDKNVLYAL